MSDSDVSSVSDVVMGTDDVQSLHTINLDDFVDLSDLSDVSNDLPSASDDSGGQFIQPVVESRQSTHHMSAVSASLENEFLCSCCFELLVEPTTLVCGHNFCRLCLANSYFSGHQRRCPVCRQVWNGHPKVNILLRSTSEKLFAEKMIERQRSLTNDQHAKKILAKFDRELQKPQTQAATATLTMDFWTGVICTIVISMALMIMSWLVSNDRDAAGADKMMGKSVAEWSTTDVAKWLGTLGPWTSKISTFSQVDGGKLLLTTNNEWDLILNNITSQVERESFMDALTDLKMQVVNAEWTKTNFWHYKDLHHGQIIFLLFGLRDFPRLTLLFLFTFEYTNSLHPFLMATYPDFTSDKMIDTGWTFLTQVMIVPYFVIAKYALAWFSRHSWLASFIMVECCVQSFKEVASSVHRLRNGLFVELDQVRNRYMKFVLMMLLWPVTPNFLYDIIFHYTIFVDPLFHIHTMFHTVFQNLWH